jgi:hypothetical protein
MLFPTPSLFNDEHAAVDLALAVVFDGKDKWTTTITLLLRYYFPPLKLSLR